MTLVTPPSGPDFDVTDYEALIYYRREPGYVVHDSSGPFSPAPTLPAWAASTTYKLGQEIRVANGAAVALSDHVSGSTYAADLAAGKWKEVGSATSGAGLPVGIPASGDYIASQFGTGNGTSTTAALGDCYFVPVLIASTITAASIQIQVNTAGAGGLMRLGIYASDSRNRAGVLLLDAGTVDSSTTGLKSVTISQSLPTGLYWLAVAVQGTTASQYRAYSAAVTGPAVVVGSSALVMQTPGQNYYRVTGVTGALPTPANPATVLNASGTLMPIIGLVAA